MKQTKFNTIFEQYVSESNDTSVENTQNKSPDNKLQTIAKSLLDTLNKKYNNNADIIISIIKGALGEKTDASANDVNELKQNIQAALK